MAASADEKCGLNDLECKPSACLAGQYGLGGTRLQLKATDPDQILEIYILDFVSMTDKIFGKKASDRCELYLLHLSGESEQDAEVLWMKVGGIMNGILEARKLAGTLGEDGWHGHRNGHP